MEKKVTKQEAERIYRENNNRVVDETVDGFVVLKDVNKIYDNRVQAVFDFNLSVAQNEFIVLVGPSGCGKSTTLRMIAGLEEITSGYLYIDKVLSNYLESKDRDIAMVFQSYALYPNMTVYDNIGFGLKVRGVPKDVIKEKVFAAADILDLGPYLDRKPKELSGGQMQRVALGRAIVRNAKLFLMDEPLSNLDAKLRVQMRSEIVKLHRNVGATTIYVTHDQTEAMTMADRIVIMNKGVVQQIGTPMEIYNNPRNVFVATFIGNPPMNVFKTSLAGGKITSDDVTITLPEGTEQKYRQFIEGRRAFFEDFKRKADLVDEYKLVTRISEFLSEVKNMDIPKREAALLSICETAKTLSVDKGFIKFDIERQDALMSDLKAGDMRGLKRDLKTLTEDLKNCDLAVAAVLKRFDSAGMFKNKTESEPQADVKEKKKGKTEKVELFVQNNEIIDNYLKAYGDPSAAEQVYVGIRPEDIHFAEEVKGKRNYSEPFKVEAAFVELLGSEFNVYFELFGMRIIMKTGLSHMVKTGDVVELCFDMNKVKLFDGISCEEFSDTTNYTETK